MAASASTSLLGARWTDGTDSIRPVLAESRRLLAGDPAEDRRFLRAVGLDALGSAACAGHRRLAPWLLTACGVELSDDDRFRVATWIREDPAPRPPA